MTDDAEAMSNWWETAIIDMKPGSISFRGHPIEELIGTVTFPQMIWLMTRGSLPTPEQAQLLESALVASVDHGPQAPSIAAARMAATCGVGLNAVIATAVNMLGDTHGGAGEQCAELYYDVVARTDSGLPVDVAVPESLSAWRAAHGHIVPGFGHRFHKPVDPRAPRLMELVREAAESRVVNGRFAVIGKTIQEEIGRQRGAPIAMNIDGATAVVFCELDFAPPLSRGLFCLSRAVGALAHGWEQMQRGERNKGPMPKNFLPSYTGDESD